MSQGLHDHFKSSDDWLDDWEEIDRVEKKPVFLTMFSSSSSSSSLGQSRPSGGKA